MRILVTGAKGMLGRTLARHLSNHELTLVGREDFDLTDPRATHETLTAARPEVVIHAAAFTAVDRCESEVETAFAVNAIGAGNVALAAHRIGARLLALSTDYVFSGQASEPYVETDPAQPRTVYGRSKWAGEEAVRAHCPDHCILRVAWLYGQGGPSFVHTMMRLGAQGGEALRVVSDQVGNPTSCDAVAHHIGQLLEVPVAGTFHFTCEGETSWYDFTRAIFARQGYDRGVEPCTTEEYPRPAPRPLNSRLDNRALRALGLDPFPSWQTALDRFLDAHPDG